MTCNLKVSSRLVYAFLNPYSSIGSPVNGSRRKRSIPGEFPGIGMEGKPRGRRIFAVILLLIPLMISCGREDSLERIRASGEIILITRNNAHCYYTYRDEPLGFEYDLAKAFSEYLGVDLRVITPAWEDLFKTLEEGRGDFIAASMTITPSRSEQVDFANEYLSVQQKIIVHNRARNIERIEDLEGKTIHVRRGTSYEERLRELRNEGLDIRIKTHEDMPTEELIGMVASGEIEATVTDSNIAVLNRRYYPDVRIGFPIEEPESLGWAVRKGEKGLLGEINKFFEKARKNGIFADIYNRYYAHAEIFDYMDLKKYHRRLDTRLPVYERIIRKAARKCGFDWRLISAMIYQESHFDPKARSFTGVEGLMQLTRNTAEEMGIDDRLDPEQSIMGGVKYLKKLYDRYDDAEDPDRTLIALAAYNVGHGHVRDAQRMAMKRNLNPNSWSSLQQILPLLRHPRYYRETKHGYARGTEPVRYVNRILTYYDILKRGAPG